MTALRSRPGRAAVVACLLLAAPAADAQAETAKPAAGFRQSVGINLHTGYTGTGPDTWGVNAPIGTVQQRLSELGVNRVRGTLCDSAPVCQPADSERLKGRMVTLGQGGVRFLLTAGNLVSGATPAQDALRGTAIVNSVPSGSTATDLTPYVDAFEGINEPPHANTGNGTFRIDPATAGRALAVQQALWNARNGASAALKTKPVLNSAPAYPSSAPDLAGQAPYATVSNSHSYRDAESPDRLEKGQSFASDIHAVRMRVDGATKESGTCKVAGVVRNDLTACNAAVFGAGRQTWVTETGYRDYPWSWSGWTTVQNGVTSDLAKAWIPRLAFDAYRMGISRTYLYQLIDRENAGASPVGTQGTYDGKETRRGLLQGNAALTPKPAFYTLKNALSVVGDLGAGGVGGSLNLSITRGGTPLTASQERHLLLRRIDGSYVLAIWAPDGPRYGDANGTVNNHWTPTASQPTLPVVTDNVKIDVGGGPWTIREYRPYNATAATPNPAPLQTVTGNSITSSVSWDVRLFDLRTS